MLTDQIREHNPLIWLTLQNCVNKLHNISLVVCISVWYIIGLRLLAFSDDNHRLAFDNTTLVVAG